MNGRGIDAFYQPIDKHRGNAIGRLAGSGGGADLLFYGHLDTTFSADAREDAQMTGGRPRPDLEPRLRRDGDLLYGLGVQNPKGSTVCAIAALDATVRAGIPLKGGASIGIAAGGIHKGPVEGLMRTWRGRRYQGFGVGCEYMLTHGLTADYCISTKPGYGIVWEEPGECWFKITIMGELCYSGLRHVQPNRNPIVDAAAVVPMIEDWIADYTKRHAKGQIAPQGTVGAIEAGWPFKPEFIPGICALYVNIHTNSVTRPIGVRREFEALIDDIRSRHGGIDIRAEMLLSTPGSRTEPDNWIVRSAAAAVEAVEGRPIVVGGLSGTTDGAILRNAGIATAQDRSARHGRARARLAADVRRLPGRRSRTPDPGLPARSDRHLHAGSGGDAVKLCRSGVSDLDEVVPDIASPASRSATYADLGRRTCNGSGSNDLA